MQTREFTADEETTEPTVMIRARPPLAESFDHVSSEVAQRTAVLDPRDQLTKLPGWEIITPGSDAPAAAGTTGLYLRPFGEDREARTLGLMKHAAGQLLSRIQYPKELLPRLPQKMNVLNVNWLNQHLDRGERDVTLRTIRKSEVRAVMSARYTPFDDVDIVTALEPFLRDRQVAVRRLDFGDTETHIQVSFPDRQQELRVGDVLERAIHISNSEVGCRSVRIEGYLVRLRCTNGLKDESFEGGFMLRHIGDKGKFAGRIHDAIEATFREIDDNLSALVVKYKAALKCAIDDVPAALERVSKGGNMTQEEFKRSLAAWGAEPEPNLFGVTQAITLMAQSAGSPERQYQLESLAGRVLNDGLRN